VSFFKEPRPLTSDEEAENNEASHGEFLQGLLQIFVLPAIFKFWQSF